MAAASVCAVAAAWAAAPAPGGARALTPAPARASVAAAASHLQVSEVEYRLMLSEAVVKAGPVDLEDIDAGMDPHDLRLRHGRSHSVFAVPTLAPGARWDGTVDLKPGTYHLWCSLPGHWKLGMHAILKVVR